MSKNRRSIRKGNIPNYQRSVYDVDTDLYGKVDTHQKHYMKCMRDFPVTFVDAKSGTGKTTLAVLVGFEFLRKGISKQIVYLRFTDDRYLKNGYLPGTEEEKTHKLFSPFFDALDELGVSEEQFKSLNDQEMIKLTTDSSLRGTNLKETFLIIDEAQNAATIDDLRLVLTRLHDEGGRGVVIGHSGQQDNRKVQLSPKHRYTPFQVYEIHMLQKEFTASCKLVNNYRGEISQHADNVMETWSDL